MTEYEAAALAVQWAQVGMSGLQALVIAGGLWVLYQDGCHRDQQHEETMAALQRRDERSDQQHEETMAALRQQGEALQSVSEGIREMGEGIREMGEGIREMIARTRSV